MLLKKATIPEDLKDDTYQDFCVYYYSRNQEYNPQYAITTWLSLLFKSFLSNRAAHYNRAKRRSNLGELSMDVTNKERENTLETWFSEEVSVEPNLELSLDMTRLYKKLPPLFKTLLNTDKTPAIIAKEEGVTRQAIEAKLKRLMAKATEDYREDYA